MLKTFTHSLDNSALFCGSCRRVVEHSFRARIEIYPGAPVAAGEPILVGCKQCQRRQIYFSHEFARFSPPHRADSVFKIVGFSRLKVSDAVYIPGDALVGIIQSRYRIQDTEVFKILREDGSEVDYKTPAVSDFSPHANLFFRLLPAFTHGSRIGDPIFHIQRNGFGKIVGMIYGQSSQLAVQMADGSVILIEMPPAMQITANKVLLQLCYEALRPLQEHIEGITWDAGLGVIFAQGTCREFRTISQIKSLLATIPGARGMVANIVVQSDQVYDDEQILAQMHQIIWGYQSSVFNVFLQCHRGRVDLTALCRSETTRQELPKLLEVVPGITSLQINLRKVSDGDAQERIKAQKIAQNLRKNPALQNTQIRVSFFDNTVTLEGLVTSILQKQTAKIIAVWSNKNLSVVNRLMVTDKIQGNAYIKIA